MNANSINKMAIYYPVQKFDLKECMFSSSLIYLLFDIFNFWLVYSEFVLDSAYTLTQHCEISYILPSSAPYLRMKYFVSFLIKYLLQFLAKIF